MVSRKYTADYRLENRLSANGRLKTVPVYRGRWFAFCNETARQKKTVVRFTLLTVLLAASNFAVLMLNTPLSRRWYVTLPSVLALVPSYLCDVSLLRLWGAQKPTKVTREHHDKLGPRYAAGSALGILLGILSMAGCITGMALHGAQLMEWLYIALLIVYLGCAVLLFLGRHVLNMCELPCPEGQAPEEPPAAQASAKP